METPAARSVGETIRPNAPVVLREPSDVVRLVEAKAEHATAKEERSAKRMNLLVVAIALGGVFVDAYDFTSLGMGVIQLRSQFHLSASEVGLLSATMAVSAVFGAGFGGYFVDKLGRRRMFLLDLYFFVISAVAAALAPNLWVLGVARLMMGLGVGLDFPVALSFVAEFSTRLKRGSYVNASYVNWYTAAILGFAASFVGYAAGAGPNLWRYEVGFGAVPALILLVLRYVYMLESPLWAAHRGDLQGAAEILRRTRHIEVIVDTSGVSHERPLPSLAENYSVLFSPPYRRRAVLAAIIGWAQSIEYYAVIFYLPVISQMLFGHSLIRAIEGGVIFSSIGLAGATVQALICTKTGIRPLTILGAAIATVSLIGIAAGQSISSLPLEAVALSTFMIGHTVGPGPQGMAYGTLSFPTSIRGTAAGWTQGILRVGSVIGFLVFPISLAQFGFTATFAALAAAPAAILVATMIIRWEPVGVNIENEEVQKPAKVAPARLGDLQPATELP